MTLPQRENALTRENAELNRTNLPIIRCECGVEILLLPDLAEMSKVVEEHAHMHMENVENQREAEEVFSRIEHHLLAQILEKASYIE
jgi:hypothetical protein